MKNRRKFDKPLFYFGLLFVLAGIIYQNLDLLPVEIADLYFWLPQRDDVYYKVVVTEESSFDYGFVFYATGIVCLVARMLYIKDDRNASNK